MTRRYFTFAGLAAGAAFGQGRRAGRKILVILIDGFGMDYLEVSDMPNLKRMG